jgi:hypothetical protein
MIENIKHRIEEIENICFIFEENKNNFFDKNKNIEKEINILSKELILLENIDIDDDECINNNNNEKLLNIQSNNSSLLITKNVSGKYDSKNIFKEGENDLIENNSEIVKSISKNWNEKCYIYDDYEIRDIKYDFTVVGLPQNKTSKQFSLVFDLDTIIEIQKFLGNEKELEYIMENDHYVTFKLELYNLQSAKIHLIYKESKDLSNLS